MKKLVIKMECAICREWHSVECSANGFHAWQRGKLIQYAMPELSATEREQLISGMCPKCQDRIFGYDEDEEEG